MSELFVKKKNKVFDKSKQMAEKLSSCRWVYVYEYVWYFVIDYLENEYYSGVNLRK